MNTKKVIETNNALREYTRQTVNHTGVKKSSELSGVNIATISKFASGLENLSIEKVIIIHDAITGAGK